MQWVSLTQSEPAVPARAADIQLSRLIPGYLAGGYVVEWLDRKYAILLAFASVAAFEFFASLGRSVLLWVITPILVIAIGVVLRFGPMSRGKPLKET